MNIRNVSMILDRIFYAFLFLLPVQAVYLVREPFIGGEKWQYGTVGVYVSSVVLAVAIMIGTVLKTDAFRTVSITDRLKGLWRRQRTDLFLLCFVLWSGLSIFWSQDAVLAGYMFVKILLAADVFVMARTMVRQGKMKRIASVLFLAAVIQSVIGVGQYLTQETFSSTLLGTSVHESWQAGTSVLKNDSGRFLRAYGTFPHPNMYGLFLAVVLVLATSLIGGKSPSFTLFQRGKLPNDTRSSKARSLLFKVGETFYLPFVKGIPSPRGDCVSPVTIVAMQGFYSRIVTLTGIVIILLGLIVSFSRLAWGGFALGFAFLVWQSFRDTFVCHPGLDPGSKKETILDSGSKAGMTEGSPLAIFATIIIATAIFTGILHETVFPRFDSRIVERERSVVERMSTYDDAIRVIGAHPIVGVGAGNYTSELIRTHPERPIWAIQPAHDAPLVILSELGIIGVILLSRFAAIPIRSILGTKNAQAYAAALLVFVPSLLLDHFLWTSSFGLLFLFVLFGMSAESGSDE